MKYDFCERMYIQRMVLIDLIFILMENPENEKPNP